MQSATALALTPTISLNEQLIALSDVPDALPRPSQGRKVGRDAVWRWTRHGLAGVAPLETLHIGRDTFTSREALSRFFSRVSAAKNQRSGAATPSAVTVVESQPSASHLAADAELQRQGM